MDSGYGPVGLAKVSTSTVEECTAQSSPSTISDGNLHSSPPLSPRYRIGDFMVLSQSYICAAPENSSKAYSAAAFHTPEALLDCCQTRVTDGRARTVPLLAAGTICKEFTNFHPGRTHYRLLHRYVDIQPGISAT
jgi:hypothetical protein